MSRKMQKALHLHIEEDKKTPNYRARMYGMFEKYDGWYGYLDTEVGKIKSSAGREIPAVSKLSEYVYAKSLGLPRGRLIFEIMIPNQPFSVLNGILNRKKEQAANAYLMVHDFIPTDKMDSPFHERYIIARRIVGTMNPRIVRMAPVLAQSADKQDWKAMARTVWDKGGEGIILKCMHAKYDWGKRNASLMKIKEELTLDLRVAGMVQGAGKYAHTLGALEVVGKRGKIHTVSGMTDEQRRDWWTDPTSIIGKVVEVKAMKLLADGSLREPRFKHVRHDKAHGDIDDV
jgi:ATP-dependent DNA ligase